MITTRFAPSPTGLLHIGGARTALFNWLFSRRHGGKFLLRIEDTDRDRSDEKITKAILKDLRWLNIDLDGDVVYQSQRIERHREIAYKLLETGHAYRCYCTPEELDEIYEHARDEGRPTRYDGRCRNRDNSASSDAPSVIRFRGNEESVCEFEDLIRGKISISESELDDLVLLRADDTPTYMLSVVVDDHDMNISHIIRGEDHLTNAAKQWRIYRALGWDIPTFAHIPLIHGSDGAKLSKRHGAMGINGYRDEGYLPDALCNYLARLGWSHGDDEIFSREDAVSWFSLESVGKSPARFDAAKLSHLNGLYIRSMDDDVLCKEVLRFGSREITTLQHERLSTLMPALKLRAETLKEVLSGGDFLFRERPLAMDEKAVTLLEKDGVREMLKRLHKRLKSVADWNVEDLEKEFRAFVEEENLKMGKVAQPLRAALTGGIVSPGIFDVLAVLGREESLGRIRDISIEHLSISKHNQPYHKIVYERNVDMELPQPTHKNYTMLISSIQTGQIKIPRFQRDFVWTMERSAALLDSVVKGYPIGTFIFWRTKEHLRSLKELGGIKLRPPKRNEPIVFVLDGQQRLTSLFAAIRGLKITHTSGREENFSDICINLNATESENIVTTDIKDLPGTTFIRVTDLLYGSLTTLTKFPKKYHDKLDKYKRRIEAYDFPVIEVPNFPIDVATEIFTRINVGGKPLTVFEIMVAKTYDEKHDFDLSEKYSKLIVELEQFDYESITGQITLQLIALILKGDCRRQTILRLKKDTFIVTWPKAVDGIKKAVKHFQDVIRVPVSHLLPYVSLIIPFAYFFYHHPEDPIKNQKSELEKFFWQCSLSDRYSSSVDSKLAQDIKRIDQILKNQSPTYDWEIDISPNHIIENGWFNTGTSFIKAILCIMAYQRPLSFRGEGNVSIRNNWLKRSDSKNYHHYFPRSFFREKGVDDSFANNVVNITIVDDRLNKREIGAKPPSKYMKKFQKENSELEETMKTHLIGDLAEFGIWDDDYGTFLQKRAEAISKEIKKRIIVR